MQAHDEDHRAEDGREAVSVLGYPTRWWRGRPPVTSFSGQTARGDATRGTLRVQFEFPNPDLVLRPGQFGRAKVLIETLKGALLVPQRAVQEVQNLNTVAVVGADNKVAIRTVKVGRRVDNNRVVEDGLRAGDRVIVEGIQNVQNGMTVTAKPAPADKPAAAAPPTGTR